jgi:hypothetical protein
MKRVVYILLTLLCVLGCARRKEIDDKTLAQIFRDAYLTNAYLGINYINIDSIQIYEPILDQYGYTPEDLRYTIGNFSRRKSAQLGRVLKEAEKEIAEYAVDYEKRVVVLDTIKDVAIRSFKRMVYQDSLIEVKKRADTSKLKLTIEPLQPGTYSVRYKYTYNKKEEPKRKKSKKRPEDELTLRGALYIETFGGSHRNNYSYNLRKEESIRRTLIADTSAHKLVLTFAKPSDARHKIRNIDLKVEDIEILYTPSEEMAIDSLFMKYVDIKIFDNVFFNTPTDSLPLPADTTRVL